MLGTTHLVTDHLIVEELCDQQHSYESLKSHSAYCRLCLAVKSEIYLTDLFPQLCIDTYVTHEEVVWFVTKSYSGSAVMAT
jgi:hypothetical protein